MKMNKKLKKDLQGYFSCLVFIGMIWLNSFLLVFMSYVVLSHYFTANKFSNLGLWFLATLIVNVSFYGMMAYASLTGGKE